MNSSSPVTPRELNAEAMRAMAAGDYNTAQALLRQGLSLPGNKISLWLNLAATCRVLSNLVGAMSAVEEALKIDPRSFMALLMKGSLLERTGQHRQAAKIYGFALALVPPENTLDVATVQALAHARNIHARYLDELEAFVNQQIGDARARGNTSEARRINVFLDHTVRRKTIYRQEPSDYFYPGLPAIEFYDRDEFPWLETLEANTAKIRTELLNILREDFKDFVPYVAYPDGLPLDQWHDLNHSTRWGALHLLLSGKRVDKNCGRCPQTMAALETLPQPKMQGRSPAAMFSALQPTTQIPPHNGVANTRLVLHLPLIVPEACGFRVGHQVREWREGEAWVFDDTIEHEAWNNSAQPRTIFICDIWNPRISLREQEVIVEIVRAMDFFHGVSSNSSL